MEQFLAMHDSRPEPIFDKHIRSALVKYLRDSDPTCAIFHETPLARGLRRADVLAVNGHIAGFEIKSERDSLTRLAKQVDYYNLVCEFSTIVTAKSHLSKARAIIPQSWGIMTAEGYETVSIKLIRKPKLNRHLDKWALIRLMWKEECSAIVKKYNRAVKPDLPVIRYWEFLEELSLNILRDETREALKRRQLRRLDQPQKLSDD
jgi:hypothetical protein